MLGKDQSATAKSLQCSELIMDLIDLERVEISILSRLIVNFDGLN